MTIQRQVEAGETVSLAAAGWAILLAQGSEDVYKAQVEIAQNASKSSPSDAGLTYCQ